jgi:hypothetical protein
MRLNVLLNKLTPFIVKNVLSFFPALYVSVIRKSFSPSSIIKPDLRIHDVRSCISNYRQLCQRVFVIAWSLEQRIVKNRIFMNFHRKSIQIIQYLMRPTTICVQILCCSNTSPFQLSRFPSTTTNTFASIIMQYASTIVHIYRTREIRLTFFVLFRLSIFFPFCIMDCYSEKSSSDINPKSVPRQWVNNHILNITYRIINVQSFILIIHGTVEN